VSGDLGQVISVHRGKITAGGWLWYLGVIFFLSGIASFVKAVQDQGMDEQAFGVLGMCLGLSFLFLIVPVMRWRQKIEVHENGLVHKKLFGTVTIRKEQAQKVTLIRHNSRTGYHEEVCVDLHGGGSRSFSGIDEAEKLSNYIAAWARVAGLPQGVSQGPTGWQPPAQQAPGTSGPTGWQPPPQSPGGWKPPT